MKYDWILDVLEDLSSFAQANGLNAIAEQLEETKLIATVEIASVGGDVISGKDTEAGQARENPGEFGASLGAE